MLKTVFIEFRKNFKGLLFYSERFSEQKKLMKWHNFIRTFEWKRFLGHSFSRQIFYKIMLNLKCIYIKKVKKICFL